jgi:hypothetical protein
MIQETLTTFPFEQEFARSPSALDGADGGAFNKLLQKVKSTFIANASSNAATPIGPYTESREDDLPHTPEPKVLPSGESSRLVAAPAPSAKRKRPGPKRTATDSLLSLVNSHVPTRQQHLRRSAPSVRLHSADDVSPPSAQPLQIYSSPSFSASTEFSYAPSITGTDGQGIGSIPGFPIKDSEETKSMSSSFRGGPGVSHIFRRLRGEVSIFVPENTCN